MTIAIKPYQVAFQIAWTNEGKRYECSVSLFVSYREGETKITAKPEHLLSQEFIYEKYEQMALSDPEWDPARAIATVIVEYATTGTLLNVVRNFKIGHLTHGPVEGLALMDLSDTISIFVEKARPKKGKS